MKSLLYSLPIAVATVIAPALAHADISFVVNIAPPVLPVYVQPPIPGYGYIWTPGYWSWSYDYGDYYWVAGTWVKAPYVGALWTPGYWAANGDRYGWREGYWGSRIGFYGGVNYGYGYVGVGYQGGYWNNGEFRYNRAVNNIATTNITNVYNTTVVNNITNNHISYNGGNGIRLLPSRAEQYAVQIPHVGPTAMQVQHRQVAIANPMQLASANYGSPKVAAMPAPAAFNAPKVVAAAATHGQPVNRFYGGAQYQPPVSAQHAALHSQFQQQVVQQARPTERYVPQESLHPLVMPRSQAATIPASRRQVPSPPVANQQRMARPPPQEYGHERATLQAQPMEHRAPSEIARVQTAVATQVHQGAPHQWHSHDK